MKRSVVIRVEHNFRWAHANQSSINLGQRRGICTAERGTEAQGILTLSLGYPDRVTSPLHPVLGRYHVSHSHHICSCIRHRARFVDRKVGSPTTCTFLPRARHFFDGLTRPLHTGMVSISTTLRPECPETSARAQVGAPIEKGRTLADECSGPIRKMGETSSERRQRPGGSGKA